MEAHMEKLIEEKVSEIAAKEIKASTKLKIQNYLFSYVAGTTVTLSFIGAIGGFFLSQQIFKSATNNITRNAEHRVTDSIDTAVNTFNGFLEMFTNDVNQSSDKLEEKIADVLFNAGKADQQLREAETLAQSSAQGLAEIRLIQDTITQLLTEFSKIVGKGGSGKAGAEYFSNLSDFLELLNDSENTTLLSSLSDQTTELKINNESLSQSINTLRTSLSYVEAKSIQFESNYSNLENVIEELKDRITSLEIYKENQASRYWQSRTVEMRESNFGNWQVNDTFSDIVLAVTLRSPKDNPGACNLSMSLRNPNAEEFESSDFYPQNDDPQIYIGRAVTLSTHLIHPSHSPDFEFKNVVFAPNSDFDFSELGDMTKLEIGTIASPANEEVSNTNSCFGTLIVPPGHEYLIRPVHDHRARTKDLNEYYNEIEEDLPDMIHLLWSWEEYRTPPSRDADGKRIYNEAEYSTPEELAKFKNSIR